MDTSRLSVALIFVAFAGIAHVVAPIFKLSNQAGRRRQVKARRLMQVVESLNEMHSSTNDKETLVLSDVEFVGEDDMDIKSTVQFFTMSHHRHAMKRVGVFNRLSFLRKLRSFVAFCRESLMDRDIACPSVMFAVEQIDGFWNITILEGG